jgi:hypothetical protein
MLGGCKTMVHGVKAMLDIKSGLGGITNGCLKHF